jgi:hypothetical protein
MIEMKQMLAIKLLSLTLRASRTSQAFGPKNPSTYLLTHLPAKTASSEKGVLIIYIFS